MLWVGSTLIVVAETADIMWQSGTIFSLPKNGIWLIAAIQALFLLVDIVNTVTLCIYWWINKAGFST